MLCLRSFIAASVALYSVALGLIPVENLGHFRSLLLTFSHGTRVGTFAS